jgi:hypothetical protein
MGIKNGAQADVSQAAYGKTNMHRADVRERTVEGVGLLVQVLLNEAGQVLERRLRIMKLLHID